TLFNISTSTDIDERRIDGRVRLPAGLLSRRLLLDVEANVQDVAVLDDVRLAFEPLEAASRGLRVRAGLDEVYPADHLGADEATGDVRVDRLRRLEGRPSALQR